MRHTFAAGFIPSKREELAALQERLKHARQNVKEHPSHANEIAEVYADLALEDFLEKNPGLETTDPPPTTKGQ